MKLIAAVDLSNASAYVIEAVHRVALATDATVYVLHVVGRSPVSPGPEFPVELGAQELAEHFVEEQERLGQLVGQLVEVGVNANAVMAQGDPAKTVLAEAKRLDAELIVIGSHGHGALFDALVGSVSADVLRHSPVPVLVVPTREM